MPAPQARHQPPWFARQRRRVQPTLGRTAVQSPNYRAARRIGRRLSGSGGEDVSDLPQVKACALNLSEKHPRTIWLAAIASRCSKQPPGASAPICHVPDTSAW